jgi:hypothetical protein
VTNEGDDVPRLLELEDDLFTGGPVRIGHVLAGHELLSVGALADLADALPSGSVEHNSGQISAVLPDGTAPRLDASPGEIARGIESNGCWMVLKNVEQAEDYAELLGAALDELAPYLPRDAAEMFRREGFVFLSAPESVTPAHVDPEHNFLLQIRGTKTMSIGRFEDAREEQLELERHYGGGHRNMPSMFHEPVAHVLEPGDGVYVPVNAPHWVQNGGEVSVSLSITWRTRASDRLQRIHAFNARLRRAGLSPARPGAYPARDRAKATAGRVIERLAR